MPGVVFAPERKTWLDYAAPIIQQYLMGAINRTDQANQYKREQMAAQEAQKRQQEQQIWRSQQLANILGGGGQQPGQVQIPGMANNGGGGLNLRDPNDAFTKIAVASAYMPDEFQKRLGDLLGNFNAPYTSQEFNLGDRKMIGTLNPSTGEQLLQEMGIGLNPDTADTNNAARYVSNNSLRGTLATAGSTIKSAEIRAEVERAVAEMNLSGTMTKSQIDLKKAELEDAANRYVADQEVRGREITAKGAVDAAKLQSDATKYNADNTLVGQKYKAEQEIEAEKIKGLGSLLSNTLGREKSLAEVMAERGGNNSQSLYEQNLFNNALNFFGGRNFGMPTEVIPEAPTLPSPPTLPGPRRDSRIVNPFKGLIDDEVYQRAKALGKSDQEIMAALLEGSTGLGQ